MSIINLFWSFQVDITNTVGFWTLQFDVVLFWSRAHIDFGNRIKMVDSLRHYVYHPKTSLGLHELKSPWQTTVYVDMSLTFITIDLCVWKARRLLFDKVQFRYRAFIYFDTIPQAME